jgi:hypothetical protein
MPSGGKRFYSHFELHFERAKACLEAGRADNAATWIQRDLAECGDDRMPKVDSLKMMGNWIEFEYVEATVENVSGMGI